MVTGIFLNTHTRKRELFPGWLIKIMWSWSTDVKSKLDKANQGPRSNDVTETSRAERWQEERGRERERNVIGSEHLQCWLDNKKRDSNNSWSEHCLLIICRKVPLSWFDKYWSYSSVLKIISPNDDNCDNERGEGLSPLMLSIHRENPTPPWHCVRRQCIHGVLLWLLVHNCDDKDITILVNNLTQLPADTLQQLRYRQCVSFALRACGHFSETKNVACIAYLS